MIQFGFFLKIVILTLGKTSASYLREGISVYQDRLKHYAKVEYKELPDVPAKGISSEVLKLSNKDCSVDGGIPDYLQRAFDRCYNLITKPWMKCSVSVL